MPKNHNILRVFRQKNKIAFSLIEVSIVMMIIGVLIAATISAKALIKNSRIAAAQAKTRAAPVNSIPNSVIWLESSLETSFSGDEAQDGANLSSWNDIKSGSAAPINNGAAGSTNPTYSNTINDIQAVKFSGNANSYFEIDGSALNGSDYTIIILEKRLATGANYFLSDDGTSTSDNESIQLGYSASGTVKHSQGSGNEYTGSVGDYSSAGQNPRIFTFIQNNSTGKQIYVNGYLAAEDSDTTQLTGINKLHLGKGYDGEIGEFMIFDRALKKEERTSIETYLTEKWRMKTITTSNNNQSCTDGIVKDSGCAQACAVSVVGESDTAKADGESGDFDCDKTGYTGTVAYSCSNGTPITGTCSCDTASGYYSSGGACVLSCAITGEVGITDGTIVTSSSGSQTCNATNFNDSVTYTCSGGVFTKDSGQACDTCDAGWDIASACTSCDSSAGYVDDGNGGCEIPPPFITTWKTDNSGVSGSSQIKLPTKSTGSYNFTVDWGDGNTDVITSYNQAQTTHTYASAGTYTIEISGTFEGIQLYGGDAQKLLNISQWGVLDFGRNAQDAFRGASNLTITATDTPTTSSCTSMSWMFGGTSSLITIPGIGSWDTSLVTNMGGMFGGSAINEPSLANLNTSSVIDATYMFFGATSFNQNIGSWDVSKITNMDNMFRSATSFNQDIGGWNTVSVTRLHSIFRSATSFNQDLSGWNYENCTIFNVMFWYATSLSAENWSNLLVALNSTPSVRSTARTIQSSSTTNSAGTAAKNSLINTYGWNVLDNGS